MSARDYVRRLRLYYRSTPLFRERLVDPGIARWLPFAPSEKSVALDFCSGRRFRMRAGQWPLLPTACRLERLGAEFEFLPDAKRISFDGLTFYSPLELRSEADYLDEVFVQDIYGAKRRRFDGKVVVDVGAYIGDSALAFARQGARVHAVEPSETFCRFLRQNLAENGLAENVTVHSVGFQDRAEDISSGTDRLHFVEGVGYTLANLPTAIELLKLDCEGGEYHLLADPRFLAHLAPQEIRMEYHRGLEPLIAPLAQAGYTVDAPAASESVGILSARKKGH